MLAEERSASCSGGGYGGMLTLKERRAQEAARKGGQRYATCEIGVKVEHVVDHGAQMRAVGIPDTQGN